MSSNFALHSKFARIIHKLYWLFIIEGVGVVCGVRRVVAG